MLDDHNEIITITSESIQINDIIVNSEHVFYDENLQNYYYRLNIQEIPECDVIGNIHTDGVGE